MKKPSIFKSKGAYILALVYFLWIFFYNVFLNSNHSRLTEGTYLIISFIGGIMAFFLGYRVDLSFKEGEAGGIFLLVVSIIILLVYSLIISAIFSGVAY